MREAQFYRKLNDKQVECTLCPHFCKLKEGQIGICRVRQNIDGTLYSLVYGKAVAVHVDPIEKKPLFHVAPGSKSFSVATAGCNFKCKFCQNFDISQLPDLKIIDRYSRQFTPQDLVEIAIKNHCKSIAYTYTEPTIFYEYAYDTAKLAHEVGIINVFVTNGYINPDPLKKIKPYLDAANVDLKSYRDEFYRKFTGARLQPVLDTLKLMKNLDIWLEVTTLVIPGENDSTEELTEIARFISNELGAETPWHVSRFYPQYQLQTHPPTPVSTLERAFEIGKAEGLRYVYVGNVPGGDAENTVCPSCGKTLIRRVGYQILENNIKNGMCAFCEVKIDGLEM
ncbi:AmmeMemoRadiSam system radical SAM enzyme [candidate division KSB1 bacterium 4484_87]|nr:MAG: AmmeMemoRadiSam system radical SAM enzyme [candidate division KSB1 bacterium 4484_87]